MLEGHSMSLVSFVKIHRNGLSSIKKAISQSLELIDYSFEKEARNVVIKPNLCYYWDYSTGQTTDPKFVAALIEIIRERISPDSIILVESDASAMKCKYAFKMLGYEKLAQDYDVKLVNLSENKSDSVKTSVGKESFRMAVPQALKNTDLKINVAKIKYTARGINITCALKNVFGCNPSPKKFRYHSKLGKIIVATNKVIKFNLTLIDGNTVSGIQPRRLGLVMASRDPVAVDAAASKIAGIDPNTVRYIQLAQREGLGSIRYVSKGESLEYFKARYPKKGARNKLMGQAYSMVVRMGLGSKLGLD